MMRIVMIFFLLMVNQKVVSQKINYRTSDSARHYGVDYRKAEFMGGYDSLNIFVTKNMRYPDAAREMNISGRVIVRFLLDENGSISKLQVVRGIGGGCDEEAMRMVKNMPAWKPATYKGKPTRSIQILPVVFKLE